jgi:hypothetical protein
MRVYSAGLLMVVGVVGAGLLAPAQGQAPACARRLADLTLNEGF